MEALKEFSWADASDAWLKLNMEILKEQEAIKEYSTTDVSDALLKLRSQGGNDDRERYSRQAAGAIIGLTLQTQLQPGQKVIGRTYTVKFDDSNFSTLPSKGRMEDTDIPPGTHYIDHLPQGSILVLQQPKNQDNACFGGIMALRAQMQGVQAVLVDGRIRDVEEMRQLGLPVYSTGTSIAGAGAGAGCKARFINEAIHIGHNGIICPEDLLFIDTEGICVLNGDLNLGELLAMLKKLSAQEERVKEAVRAGMTVSEAFKKYRS
ncbi:ribonuclease E inhibitor RraA/Dimethylmenaquinone methyltransferase [Protomyces lactucae-debilis]|uniref:Ribonuclease E inhibitor RraA/Dimethylmenaquinone methyltransferase n=1 Tax=Protomyces lactucae-debilis TaxID=2754530 RepID=A0A1Y2FIE1_PROLT|nr:ribonuclease E inhibitor RraA/Dimethylmenaquinone methyltransferase [Protomyces lactucae-debilis]ORY82585.1 ribonuclease E inhibitor RraA/Dimethylmenaquinone methyltransferase [Protomyces lactucae-debilis]